MGNQYLSTLDAANHSADDEIWSVGKKGHHGDKFRCVVDVQQRTVRVAPSEGARLLPQSALELAHSSPRWDKVSLSADLRSSMMNPRPLVSIVDDDESVRESLPDLLKELGFASQTFSSAEEFIVANETLQTKCLILDIAMRGMNGPELQQELKRRKIDIPIIFITARRDETIRSRLIEQGAITCLIKPFSDTALLEALNSALPAK